MSVFEQLSLEPKSALEHSFSCYCIELLPRTYDIWQLLAIQCIFGSANGLFGNFSIFPFVVSALLEQFSWVILYMIRRYIKMHSNC